MLPQKIKKNKPVVTFSSYTPKEFRSPQNRNYDGQLAHEALLRKGQLFIITSATNSSAAENRTSESGITENILKEVYYSHPSDDVVTCLKHAFDDANTLVNELLNDKGKKQQLGVKCTALVVTNERGYIAQVGDIHVYRATKDKLERLTSDNILVGGKQSFALGPEAKINIHFNRYIALKAGDSYLLSTDGLTNVNHHLVRRILLGNNPGDACRKVTDLIQKEGHTGRIKVQVVQVNFTPGLPIQPKHRFLNQRAWGPALLLLLFALSATFVFYKNKSELPEQAISQARAIQVNDPPGFKKEEPLIEESENNKIELTSSEPARQIVDDEHIKPNESENPVAVKTKAPEPGPPILVSPSLSDQWNLKNLRKSDYEINDNRITFLATPNIKKTLFRTAELRDFTIQIEARIKRNNASGRFGVIVGYRTMVNRPYEIYYLLSLFRQQEFLLQKYSGFRKELVTRIPINFDSLQGDFQDIQLEVKCFGPFIELHANQKQIFRWRTGEKIVTGQVGIFVSPETEVEVSKFEIVTGVEFSRK